MMDSIIHTHTHFNWFELLEIYIFSLLVLFLFALFVRFFVVMSDGNKIEKIDNTFVRRTSLSKIPEIQLLMLALPLELLWEIAQFPLYTVWHEGDWSYILYGLVHCTLGDLLILLSVFWIVSMLNRSRNWIFSPNLPNVVLFTVLGLAYTIYSEILNESIKGTWGYTELMPIIPVINVGGMPFLQWLLIPPILIWLLNILKPQHSI